MKLLYKIHLNVKYVRNAIYWQVLKLKKML